MSTTRCCNGATYGSHQSLCIKQQVCIYACWLGEGYSVTEPYPDPK